MWSGRPTTQEEVMTDSSTKQGSVAVSGTETAPGGENSNSRRSSLTSSAVTVEIEETTPLRCEASSTSVSSSISLPEGQASASPAQVISSDSNLEGGSENVVGVPEPTTADNITSTTSTSDTPNGESNSNQSEQNTTSTATNISEMNGNSSRPSTSPSTRRQRNGLFGINIDLNFDPSWLVPSNVAGRSISSLSVLPEWVRRPVDIIPNRGADNSSNSALSDAGRHGSHNNYYQPHHSSSTSSGAASRLVTHSHQHAPESSWNTSSFASSSSIPNMPHHSVPLRTRHTVTSMRSVDEDLDADYNPVSTIDLGAGRERGDSHSYVIDMDSPMGGWAEDDGVVRGAVGGNSADASNVTSASVGTDENSSGNVGDRGVRRSASEANLPQGATGGGNGDGNSPSMADAATAANERTRAAEILRDAPETRAFINEISRYTTIRPFIVINFLKGVFDHGTSILAFLALVVTFSHANSMVKKEVSKQRKRNLLYLSMIVINLAACVAFIYYIFNEMELYYALIFLPTGSDLTSFWSLMWVVGVTDYVAKFGTVLAKILVVSLPGCVLPFQKRGKYYLFVEITSQLYRSFLPVYPWLFYLVSAYDGTAKMFGLFLAGLYVCFKISDSIGRFKEWLKALEKLLSNVHYGSIPTAKQLDSAGTICPICHDNFASPTRLACTHIFCEECVATWFDRERTCPMCRAKVVDDPTYRDGSTAQYVQLF